MHLSASAEDSWSPPSVHEATTPLDGLTDSPRKLGYYKSLVPAAWGSSVVMRDANRKMGTAITMAPLAVLLITSCQNPASSNAAPVAAMSHAPTNPSTGTQVTFDASDAEDSDGSISKYRKSAFSSFVGVRSARRYRNACHDVEIVDCHQADDRG